MRMPLCLIASLLITQPAFAGPFGLEEGQTLKELDIIGEIGDGFYYINVPNPHSAFESYMALISKNHGLCKITAVSRDYSNDRYGYEIESDLRSIVDVLSKKYGEPDMKFDYLNNNAIYTDRNEWVASIYYNERSFSFYWTKPSEAMKVEKINAIGTFPVAESPSDATFGLSYEFDNMELCSKDKQMKDNSAL